MLDLLHGLPTHTFLLALFEFSLDIEVRNQRGVLLLVGALKAIGAASANPTQKRPF